MLMILGWRPHFDKGGFKVYISREALCGLSEASQRPRKLPSFGLFVILLLPVGQVTECYLIKSVGTG